MRRALAIVHCSGDDRLGQYLLNSAFFSSLFFFSPLFLFFLLGGDPVGGEVDQLMGDRVFGKRFLDGDGIGEGPVVLGDEEGFGDLGFCFGREGRWV